MDKSIENNNKFSWYNFWYTPPELDSVSKKKLQKSFFVVQLNSALLGIIGFFIITTLFVIPYWPFFYKQWSLDLFIPYISFFAFVILFCVFSFYKLLKLTKAKNPTVKPIIIRFMYFGAYLISTANFLHSFSSYYNGNELISLVLTPFYFNCGFLFDNSQRIVLNIYYYILFILGIFLTNSTSHPFLYDVLALAAIAIFMFYLLGLYNYNWFVKSWIQRDKLKVKNIELINANNELNYLSANQEIVVKALYKELNLNEKINSNPIEVSRQITNLFEKYRSTQTHLLESKERYYDLFKNVNDGIAFIDKESYFTELNPKGIEVLDFTSIDYTKIKLEELIHDEYSQKFNSSNKKLIEENDFFRFEGLINTPVGTKKYVEISASPVESNTNIFEGARLIFRDITARKKAEMELEEARTYEKNFLTNMSHEIRTPLNAIIGLTHLLFDTKLDGKQLEYLKLMDNSSSFLLSLLNDLLDISKLNAGKVVLNNRPHNLKLFLETIFKTFRFKSTKEEIELKLDIDSKINSYYLLDETLFNQLLFNLLGNAEKFTKEGSITLKATILNSTPLKDSVEICVIDTGVGISEEEQKSVFEKFSQASNHAEASIKGTGLGLAICNEIVNIMGGAIDLSSTLSVGSTFKITLPLEKTVKIVKKSDTHRSSEEQIELKNISVLLAEDNEMNRFYLTNLLKKWGVNYDLAYNGKDAVLKANEKKYDIILMDVLMPYMNGFEASIKIKNTDNHNSHTPIIAMTALTQKEEREKAIEAGMIDYITKPFRPETVELMLKKVMSLQKNDTSDTVKDNQEQDLNRENTMKREYIDELYGGNFEVASEVFTFFIDVNLPQLTEFKNEISQLSDEEIVSKVHSFKPSFSMIGMGDYTNTFDTIEKELTSSDTITEEIKKYLVETINEFLGQKELLLKEKEFILSKI